MALSYDGRGIAISGYYARIYASLLSMESTMVINSERRIFLIFLDDNCGNLHTNFGQDYESSR